MDTQCVIAIATVAQDVLLVGNGILVYLYLKATKDIAQRNREQVSETQKLVETAQTQLTVSQEQIRISLQEAEAQIRPVLIVDKGPSALAGATISRNLVFVQNVGNGPALNLQLSVLQNGQPVNWDTAPIESSFSAWYGISIETGVNTNRAPLNLPEHIFGNKLTLTYESMSGKNYMTIVFIDNAGLLHNTEFLQQ